MKIAVTNASVSFSCTHIPRIRRDTGFDNLIELYCVPPRKPGSLSSR